MNKISAALGTVLVIIAGFLFLIVYSGGKLAGMTVTGTDPTANFLAFFFVIVFLPVGAGLAFFGYAYRRPAFAAGAGQQVVYKGSSGMANAALALGVIALLLAIAAFGVMLPAQNNNNSSINNLNSQVSSINTKLGNVSSGSVKPQTVAWKVDWCNTDPTSQDRFCPNTIVVYQGDIVQVMFIHNDTDAHTFTLDTSPYSFQINASAGGMRNFLTNLNNAGNCSNTGSYNQEKAGLSDIYCVSGSSLLSAGPDFQIAQNPTPASPFANGTGPIIVKVDNQVHFDAANLATINAADAGNATVEIWGIGAFQATTPGVYEFFCHYHVSNGMFGYLIVLPNGYCSSNPGSCSSAT